MHDLIYVPVFPQSMERARKIIPGGVNSPLRSFSTVGKQPIVFDKVKGAYAYDIDGNEYIDYVGSWGPAICGHANEQVNEAIKKQIEKGTSFGAPSELENELAEMVIEAVPSVEMVRFVNSGTEACLSAVRTMRAFTGKDKIIKFEGNYHGHVDALLVQAGSGAATLGVPNSPGVPQSVTSSTLSATFNDVNSVKKLFDENRGDIAGVIVEPIVGNSGYIPPQDGFLQSLRDLCDSEDAVLCFDEVMTGFRVSYGGAQELYNIKPDLTTMGKVIGGGLPVGAFGGRRDIMEVVAPAGPMYQAGTLSGNPLAMTAGIETLKIMKQEGTYEYLAGITSKLINGILQAAKENGHDVSGGSEPAMFGFFFTDREVRNIDDAKTSDMAKFKRWHQTMLAHGIYLAPSQFEAGFTSLAHTESHVQETIEIASEVMKQI